MIEYLKSLDRELLLSINASHSPFWDHVMIACTNKFVWFPFYGILLGFLIWKYKQGSIPLFITIALLILCADQLASGFAKPFFERLRPCHEPALENMLHLPVGCGGSFGFVSSHASNTFAIATFIALLLANRYISITLCLWAFIVSFSRVYLGAHYPGDVIIGGLAGTLLGFIFYKLYVRYRDKFPLL